MCDVCGCTVSNLKRHNETKKHKENVRILRESQENARLKKIKLKAFQKMKNYYQQYLAQEKRNIELEHNLSLSKSSVISRGYKYAIGSDIDEKYNKSYKGFDDINDLLEYIKVTPHCYEQLNSELCKIYVDIDFDNDQENKLDYMKLPKFKSFVNSFIKKLSNLLELELCQDDIIVLVKDKVIDECKYINSCHLIVKDYCMSRKAQKDLFKDLNYHCDLKVYGNYGQFSLKGHCKYGKTSKFYCLYKEYDDLDCLLTYTDNCKELHYNKEEEEKEVKKLNLELDEEEETPELINKEIVYISNIGDIIDTHLEKLSDKLFNNSYDWKYITRLLVKLQAGDIDYWLKYSSKKSKNENWSYESNKKFLLSIDIDKLKGGKPILLEKFNKYSDLYKFEYSVNLDKLSNYLKDKTGIVTYNKYWKRVSDNELINGNYRLDSLTGYLYEKKTSSKTFRNAKLLGNFYLEHELNLLYVKGENTNEIIYDVVVDKIDDIEIYNLLDDFVSQKFNLLVVKSFMGTGKSYYIVRNLIKKLYESEDYYDKIIDFITPNNALNVELTTKLNSYKYLQFYSHLDRIPSDLESDKYSLVCSLESIRKLNNSHTNINILVLDEIETILKHIESSTVKDKYETYKILKKVIQKSELVICLDANISKHRIEWIESILEEKRKTLKSKSLYVKQNNYLDYSHNFYLDKCYFDNNILLDLKEGKKLGFVSNRKDKTEILLRKARELDVNIPILIINGSHIKIMKGDYEIELKGDKEKKSFISDLENNILGRSDCNNIDEWVNNTKFPIQLWCFSPSVTTGTSFNSNYFDKLYCYFDNCSLPSRELIQQMYRIRNLKEKEINIYFGNKPCEIITPKSLEHYKLCMMMPFNVLTSSLNDTQTHNIIGYNDENYLNLRSYNYQEQETSHECIIQEFYKQLVYNQGIKLNFIDKEENKTLIKETDIIKQMNLEKYEDYLNTPIITMERYIKLQEKNEFDLKPSEFSELLKFKWLCKFQLKNSKLNSKVNSNHFGYYPYQFVISNQEYLNSRKFYDIYIKHKHIYNNVLSYMTFDRKKYDNQLKNPNIQIGTEVLDSKLKRNLILYKCIDKVREIFGINFDKMVVVTNKEFKELLSENIEFIQNDLYHYELSYNSSSSLNSIDIDKKENVKKVYNLINRLLSHINYGLKYMDTNTTRDNDKIKISQNNIIKLNYLEESVFNNRYCKFEIEKRKNEKIFKCKEIIRKRTSKKEYNKTKKIYKYITTEYTHVCNHGLPYLHDKDYPIKELKLKENTIYKELYKVLLTDLTYTFLKNKNNSIQELYKVLLSFFKNKKNDSITELKQRKTYKLYEELYRIIYKSVLNELLKTSLKKGNIFKLPCVYNCDDEINTIIFNCHNEKKEFVYIDQYDDFSYELLKYKLNLNDFQHELVKVEYKKD